MHVVDLVEIDTTAGNGKGPYGGAVEGGLAVLTDGGVSIVSLESWTLRRKADVMESIIPLHLRHGLVGGARLTSFGNVTAGSRRLGSSDNDGLHTAAYLIAEAHRFAATGEQEAHDRGIAALRALEMLNRVTGIDGFCARSVIDGALPAHIGGRWWISHVAPYKGWHWKGDTSSDETTGHLGAYPLAYTLLAKSAQEAELAASLHTNMVRYMIKNNYFFVGANGKPTRWGNWNPTQLNRNASWEVCIHFIIIYFILFFQQSILLLFLQCICLSHSKKQEQSFQKQLHYAFQ